VVPIYFPSKTSGALGDRARDYSVEIGREAPVQIPLFYLTLYLRGASWRMRKPRAFKRNSFVSSCSRGIGNLQRRLQHRPLRSAIGKVPPAVYVPRSNGTARLGYRGAPRPVPLHHKANAAQMTFGLCSQLGEIRAQITVSSESTRNRFGNNSGK